MKTKILTTMNGLALLLFSATLSLEACGQSTGSASSVTEPTSGSEQATVETNAPNSTYKPAFTGQTRIKGIKTTMPYEGTVLTDALKSPWGITSLPDGRLLITEREGTLRIVTPTGQASAPITGLPKVNASGQGGLLGIRTDPNFASNRLVYWVFSEPLPEGNVTAVAKGTLAADEKTIQNPTVIYRAVPAYNSSNHYGGRILFTPDGNLFISTGERADRVTRPQAQSLNSGLGKVIRITKEGTPAPGNPFAGLAGARPGVARPELYSYGHRNVQSLAIHPVTGELWEGEFGPRGGDEINRIIPGKNYGWPTITYGIEYSGEKVGAGIQQQDGLEQPVYYWDPVVSPSGMTFYSSDTMPEWKNNLFVGALSGMHIVRLVIDDNKVVGEERLMAGEQQRFRDVTQGTDGALYAITDQGRLYRIFKK